MPKQYKKIRTVKDSWSTVTKLITLVTYLERGTNDAFPRHLSRALNITELELDKLYYEQAEIRDRSHAAYIYRQIVAHYKSILAAHPAPSAVVIKNYVDQIFIPTCKAMTSNGSHFFNKPWLSYFYYDRSTLINSQNAHMLARKLIGGVLNLKERSLNDVLAQHRKVRTYIGPNESEVLDKQLYANALALVLKNCFGLEKAELTKVFKSLDLVHSTHNPMSKKAYKRKINDEGRPGVTVLPGNRPWE